MLRSIITLCATVAALTAIPAIYQSNPEAFHALFSLRGNSLDLRTSEHLVTAPTAPGLGRKVLVSSDGRGHYAATFRLNGRPVDALVDTGATLVAINTSTARRIGISLSPSDFIQPVSTANGSIKAAMVSVDRLEIGRISLNDVQALVLDDKALQTNLVGMSFLNRLDKFQAKDGTLLLVQ